MAAKMIAFEQEARQAMQRGIAKLARAVRVTLGPRGRNVIIQKSFGSPTVTKDGVTVAKEIELEDKYEDMGAKMVKEVASKTSDVAGDGTTTATVMAEAIYNEGLKAVVAGVNPMLMKRGMDKAVADIVEQLAKMSTKVTTKTETEQVATVASNFDPEIGMLERSDCGVAAMTGAILAGGQGIGTIAGDNPTIAVAEILRDDDFGLGDRGLEFPELGLVGQ